MRALGIDIGGSGIKGAPVDLEKGELAEERLRIPTPSPATPEAVAEVVGRIVEHFSWEGPVGVTFPGVVLDGITMTAANMNQGWVGVDARGLFSEATGRPVVVLNDADAAGLAEVAAGAGKGEAGVVLMLTFGTGIGSALFVDGRLVPNTELGHLELRGKDAERRASDAAREHHDLSWEEWAERVEEYLRHVEMLFSPSLIIIGGGVSKKADKFLPRISVRTRIVPATLRNEAGIVGAAMAAADL
ncbi:polyphosphate--glucose phosphotransferase [Planobispora takensis]|uniref:Polyphosphate glucokinase n=1 Tax=Planobispora takensis TaxID=1367882 RepID=A0A8J3SWH9_9ACTN|nr:ROK family protein [Planobispora takensis]GII00605.1 polyphosphate glucokinase [Planobispora takensis]